ncbi:beta strand repeat-containing protein [Arcobacter ellisii]|uniref:VWFA domain-containing protein n=1 Tax=Arcobacter ellisii TaxID=913109 RepID=A0AA94JTZ2_9BACT|nr:Calx-beta domain-containing protein [Arcobacter ellisii]RXI32369.1 hypothetical protein CP962_01855 [Arcobacter ellisii]
MKLTIKSDGQSKVVDLDKDLQFNVNKGEQYIFSNGFTSYVLNFKDNQQSVELTFKVDGKTIKVDLKGIVPLLQENVEGLQNPTLVIINKNANEKDVDNIVDNAEFNGSEIIDRLEALISNPVDLGANNSDKLAIISDFQSLIETLDAAAAGGEQGNATANGSSFNSIFGTIEDSLNGIADSAVWENLTESISTTPVETGNTVATILPIELINVNVKLEGINTSVIEGKNASYRITLTDDDGNVIVTTEDMVITFTYTYTTASGEDITEVGSVTIPAGQSEITFEISTVDDNLTEDIESFNISIDTASNQEQFDSVTIDKTPVTTTITDDKGPDAPIDEDVKANIEVSDAGSVKEADGATLTYSVKLSNAVGSDVEVDLTTGGDATRGSDYENTLQYSTDGGTTWLDVPATGKVTLPADGSSVLVKVTVKDDAITENDETVTLTATTTDAQITTQTATGTGTITDDKGPDAPIDEDVKANIEVSDAGSVKEADGATLTYSVKLSNAVGSDVEVDLTTGGDATRGSDYENTLQYSTDGGTTWLDVPATGKVTLPADGSSVLVKVTVKDDAITENDETVTLTATTTDAQITTQTATGTGTILDNDIAPITVTVSEEGLINGIIDNSGVPTDITNETKVEGYVNISNLTLSSNKEFFLNIPTISLTSNGDNIVWQLNNENKELVGKVNGENAIKITIDNNGKYTVELLKPIDHAINSVEDIESFDVNIKLKDGSFETEAKLTINIEDDMPTIETSSTTWTQSIDIPDIFSGSVSFAGNGGSKSLYTFADGAVIVTGKGFTSSTDLTLKDSNLSQSSGGLGVASTSSPYHNVANEVDFRKTADGQAASEELIIKLAAGKISYGAKINFAFMYGGELEVGVAEFYRGGVLVSTQTFSSNASSGNYAANFEVLDGGFDKIIIKATDNGNSFSIKDNSDFAVTGVQFLGTTSAQPISYAQGIISYGYGADGAGKIGFTEVSDIVKLTNGSSVVMTVTDNSIIAKDGNGALVFQVQLTPSTGKWEFYKYQDFLIGNGSEEVLDINYRVVDADGDGVNSSISIGVNKLPVSTNDVIEPTEDKSYILQVDDFGTLSNDITKIKIEILPTNGVLKLAGVVVVAGQEINKSDISSGKLEFLSNKNTDLNSNFIFKVSNGTLWSTTSYETKVNVIAEADKPTASIDVTKIVSSIADDIVVKVGNNTYNITELLANKNDSTQFKQKSNVGNNYDMDNDNTTKITVNGGLNQNDMVGGTVNNDIIIINGDVKFGTNINSTDGNDIVAILGNIYGGSFAGDNGTDYLYLGKPMSKYEILNYNGYEQGHPDMDFQLKDKDTGGILVVNNIEGIIFADGNTFGKVNVVANTTVEYSVDLSAALTDTDGSETLTAIITGVPAGATFDSQFVINDNGVWKIVIPENATSINYTDVKMTVPLSVGAFTLKIEATATEKSNNHSASAYDSDAIVYAINETNTLTFGKATTNLLFTLDVSGSMKDIVKNSSGISTTRFEIAKASIISTINAYKANGTTEVNLTLFNSGGKNIGWKTADEAIDYLSKLTMDTSGNIKYNGSSISGLTDKYTDYYDGLNATMSINFTGHKADNTVAYFLSDGVPNENKNKIDQDSDATIVAWKNYVNANINTLYVVGVGAGAQEAPLKIIQVQEGDKVIMATTDATLGDTLLGTITASISGSVADNIFGGDGIKTIDSIIVDGREYTKTTFPTDGVALDGDGKLVFNFDTGAYTYTGKSSEFTSDTTKTFKVNVSDEDGDKASLDVNIKINVNDSQYLENKAPIAYITNDGSPLLGMIDVNVANLIKLQSNQMFAVYDQDDNIKSVKISSGGLLSSLLGPITGKLVFNFDSSVNVEGFKINGIGTDSLTIVANDADGATTAQFNTLLSKIKMDYSGLLDSLLGTNVDVFGKLSIVVEDTEGLKDSKTSANLIDLELLVSNNNTEENVNLMEEDIDLTQYVTKDTNIVSFENSKLDKITIELKDILIQEDKELIVKGDKGDIVQLDTPSDWSNVGKEQLDGVNYKVYTGTGVNSTIKLLIDDDIDVTPNI